MTKNRKQACEFVQAPARITIDQQQESQEPDLGWHRTVQEQGYGLIPGVFTQDEVFDLLTQISGEGCPEPEPAFATPCEATVWRKQLEILE